ncbi:Hsp70 family protein [Candidatus Palauibacter sp.]|uniref:Hsp70 family protein n=1 Tax=Candidatus Palauibacter sp. TaxID=3101350 RepID=UPI003B525024
MSSTGRVRYGIDLGTTNSAVATLEDGQPHIIKNEMQHDTTPSAVGFLRKIVRVGQPARSQCDRDWGRAVTFGKHRPSAFEDFKGTMGTDKIFTPHGGRPYNSAELSAEVLKRLRSYVDGEAGANAAVITIPAAFTVPQQEDTQRAAKAAGFAQCTLLQEPVAASMAFGLDSRNPNGMWLVFDFGGGTFDAALVLAEDGVITVKDTEGDNHLGGRDLDLAVVDGLIIPALDEEHDLSSYRAAPELWRYLRNRLKPLAEEININLSFWDHYTVLIDVGGIVLKDGTEIDLDLEVMGDRIKPFVEPIFQRAIDKTRKLLRRHHVRGRELDHLILVGGPTHSPLFRRMIADQICDPNHLLNPMTVVAKGAALFGLTIPVNPEVAPLSPTAHRAPLQLDINYESTTVSHTQWVTVRYRVNAEDGALRPLEVELRRTGWTSGKHSIQGLGAMIEAHLEEGRLNTFEVIVTTSHGVRVETHPSEVEIIQGTKIGGAPLTNNLGFEVFDEQQTVRLFKPLDGAEKGRPLPVTGVRRGLRTTSQLRPGVASDELVLALWESGPDADGTRIFLNEFVVEYRLTGERVDRLIPEGTEFDVTLKTQETINAPKSITLKFPSLGYEVCIDDQPATLKDASLGWLKRELRQARSEIKRSRAEGDRKTISAIEVEIETRAEELQTAAQGDDRRAQEQAESRLKEALRELYKVLEEGEWRRLERELREAHEAYARAARAKGRRDEYADQVERVLATGGGDPVLARGMVEELERAEFSLMRRERAMELVYAVRAQFRSLPWKDRAEAKEAVEEALRLIASDGPDEELLPIAGHIHGLIDFEKGDPVVTGGIPRL